MPCCTAACGWPPPPPPKRPPPCAGGRPPAARRGWRLAALVGVATLFVYNADAVLPDKQRQPAGASARKAWQQQHVGGLVALTGAAALAGAYLAWADGWLRYLPALLPLAALALLYSWPLGRWRGQRRALREVPLAQGDFSSRGCGRPSRWACPHWPCSRPLAEAAGLLSPALSAWWLALAIVFDIRDLSRDRAAGTAHLARWCWAWPGPKPWRWPAPGRGHGCWRFELRGWPPVAVLGLTGVSGGGGHSGWPRSAGATTSSPSSPTGCCWCRPRWRGCWLKQSCISNQVGSGPTAPKTRLLLRDCLEAV